MRAVVQARYGDPAEVLDVREVARPSPGDNEVLVLDSPDRQRSMARLHDLVARGLLTPVVARSFPLEEVADAIAMLASERAIGRIVIVPGPS